MKKLKYYLYVTFITVGILLACNAVALASEPADFIVENGALTSYQGTDTAVIIPHNLDITAIGDGAFEEADITSVTIPDTVTSIGNDAFIQCGGLVSVTIPDSVTSVGNCAFSETAIVEPIIVNGILCYVPEGFTSYKIPDTVTRINGAFYGCKDLVSVTIPDSVTVIGDRSFVDCKALSNIVIPDSVSSIGNYAFSASGLTTLTLPDSIVSIGNNAFELCKKLTSVDMPEDLESVGISAFQGLGMETPVLIHKGEILCYVPEHFTNYTIPDTVTVINDGAFACCDKLTSVTIPDSVISIRKEAFYECKVLDSVAIPGSVNSIGEDAFSGCVGLESINIPDGVTSIGNSAFMSCSLKSITLPNSVTTIGNNAFSGCKYLESLTIPDSVTSIGEGAFSSCLRLKSVKISDGITVIAYSTFADCTALTSVAIPDGVTTIGGLAFEGCPLDWITIPDSVTAIVDDAFYCCFDLKMKGFKGSYAEEYAKNALINLSDGTKRGISFTYAAFAPSQVSVMIDGQKVSFEAYNINGSNYFKLRDLAQALNESVKQFGVGWDGSADAVNLTAAEAYKPIGGELTVSGSAAKQIPVVSTSKIYLNGSEISINAYDIGGYHYFKLQDLAKEIDFAVAWDGSVITISINTLKGYTEEN